LLLFCATLIAYWPALNGAPLWDDNAHITKPELQSLHGLWRIWFELGATQQYYPLLHSAFWAEHRLWGDSPLAYHLTNVVLHALSACLVVTIVRSLRLSGAWLAGFIFALHPVCVEAVAWISEQKSTLSTVFYLASAVAYLHFDRTRRWPQYSLALGLFVLALLSKTVTATLPAALLVVFWWQRGRIGWRRDALPLLPWFAIGVAAGLFTAWVERTYVGAHGAAFALSPLQRFLVAGRLIWFYLAKLIWPSNLTFVYPRWTIDAGVWWQYLFPAGVLVLAAGLCLAARRHRGPLAGFLFFAGTLFPVLGFFNVYPFIYSWAADHFQYLASLGIIVPAAAALSMAAGRLSLPNSNIKAAAAFLLVLLSALTWRQSGMYRDNETLFRATLARNPGSSMAHNNLGFELSKIPGRLPEAIDHFEAALRIDPHSAEAHENLGIALSKTRGRLPEAVTHLETALRLQPDYPESHLNLGSALYRTPGRLPEAIAEYQAALRLKPGYAEAHTDLGTALAGIPGRMPDAIKEYETALGINPDSAEAHYSLANALAQNPERLPEALAEYEAALRIKPAYLEARTNLATALSKIPGRLSDAIGQYEQALQIDPDSVEAHYDLGIALAQIPGRTGEARTQFEEALRLRPDLQQARQMIDGLH
jgi:tetratricopeptide (TPR) repeat protein